MELRSLLLSQDAELIEIMQQALADLGIGVEVYPTAPWAGEDISEHRFDAVIIDFEVSGASEFLRGVRTSPSNTHTLTFAIVNSDFGLPAAFAMGANLALQKPISLEAARSSLRAAYGLIMQERRRYFRYPIETLVTVKPDEHTSIMATTMNISEGGMALKCDCELLLNGLVRLEFSLPGGKEKLEARAVVVWKDSVGRVGVRFEKLSVNHRIRLSEWLTLQEQVL
jgi:CheY-like chemotaxis protein